MSVNFNSYCIYGYCVSVDDFKYMIDLAEYDSLFDWLDDYNRYEWCFYEPWSEVVYFGLFIDNMTNPTMIKSDFNDFKNDVMSKYINFQFLPYDNKQEGAIFHVFTICD